MIYDFNWFPISTDLIIEQISSFLPASNSNLSNQEKSQMSHFVTIERMEEENGR